MWCVHVWFGLHVAQMFFLRGKTSKATFFKVPKRFSFNEKQDK